MKEKIIEYLPWIVIIILIFVIDNAYGKQHEYESKEDYNRGYEDGYAYGYDDASNGRPYDGEY